MSDKSAISIIMPCHNVANHVTGAILSLQAQGFTNFEALVIDDGSRDDTVTRARNAIGRDSRFRVFQTAHRGLSAARNVGLDAAKAPLIAFLDADDAYAPDFLHRQHDEIQRTGADWTACAVALVWPDEGETAHSAIHGAPLLQGKTRWLPLQDAGDVARLFPSVWNKLYRRELIGDLRFIDRALFEDHPFFWHLATRTRRIRYIPEPLYRYTRGRAGQITDSADTAMFQQLDRLQEVIDLTRASTLTNQTAGLSRLATRVIHERLQPHPPAELRARFLRGAQHLMQTHGLHWSRDGTTDIDPAPASLLDPEFRLSVLVLQQGAQDVAHTLAALAAQTLQPVAHKLVAHSGKTALGTLIAHLPAVTSAWVSMLFAGDRPAPDWAIKILEAAQTGGSSASVVCGASRDGSAAYDSGFAQPEGPIVADPAMMILRTDHLRALQDNMPDVIRRLLELPDPVAMACLASLLHAQYGPFHDLPQPVLTLSARPPLPLVETATLLAALPIEICPLLPTGRAAVFAHLAQVALANTPTRPARLGLAGIAGYARVRSGLPVPPLASHIGPYLRLFLGRV